MNVLPVTDHTALYGKKCPANRQRSDNRCVSKRDSGRRVGGSGVNRCPMARAKALGLVERTTSLGRKEIQGNIRIRSNESESSDLRVQRRGDPNKGRRHGALSSTCVTLVDMQSCGAC